MLKILYAIFCIAGMVAFWYLMRWIVLSAPGTFGEGFVIGMFSLALLLFVLEKAGLVALVDLSKGTWTPLRRKDHRE
jgi:hypothetical protein